jgi:tRNA A37 threonylcarbamoyladenosine dehydratase
LGGTATQQTLENFLDRDFTRKTSMKYEQLFERNYGVFSPEEQERIRKAKVVIIGTGGIGGVVATTLARSGVGHFVLYEHDVYQPSNMNRQITCFVDTLGDNKAESVRDSLLKINPEAEVTVFNRAR